MKMKRKSKINMIKKWRLIIPGVFIGTALLIFLCSVIFAQTESGKRKPVYLLDVKGTINPFTAKYTLRGIDEAERADAQLVVIRMDTPGGLDSSMRDIDSAILNSDVPIAVFVGPKGARAASAGVFITYCADIAAMSPGTNIGAAHFVNMGGGDDEGESKDSWVKEIADLYLESQKRKEKEKDTIPEDEYFSGPPKTEKNEESTDDSPELEPQKEPEKSGFKSQKEVMAEKITNDAVAYIQAIADIHGRNRDWAKSAVVDSVSITSEEALKLNVIEYVVESVEDLLLEIDGQTIIKGNNEYTLNLSGAPIENVPMSWIEMLFYYITNPQIAYFLLMIGIYGLIHEVTHPGGIYPGVIGGVFLILGILAFNMLPITSIGVVLLLLGIIFMIVEVKAPGIGIFGIAGVISFTLGSFLLIDRNYTELVIKPSSYLPTAAFMFVIFVIVFPKIYQSLRGKVITGMKGLQETVGTAVQDIDPEGKVYIHGEYWNAKSVDGASIKKKSKVVIVDKDEHEMSLIVKKFENKK